MGKDFLGIRTARTRSVTDVHTHGQSGNQNSCLPCAGVGTSSQSDWRAHPNPDSEKNINISITRTILLKKSNVIKIQCIEINVI